MHPVLLSVPFLQKLWLVLDHLDTSLFLLVNTQWTLSFLDSIFPWWREANTWIPLYVFLFLLVLVNFKKQVFPWLLMAVVTFAVTDQVSSTLIKKLVQRIRPCNDPSLIGQVRLLLDHCGAGYSFTSSHATNHFGFAVFIFVTLGVFIKKWKYLFLVWAATVAYAQVYVGVHYPLDVICGGLIGAAIGFATGTFFNRRFGLTFQDTANPSI